MKKLAGRDFEDILQCAIPVFDDIFDGSLNELVLDVLFIMAEWHGVAKLRMPTTSTVALLRSLTSALGQILRRFQEETTNIDTQELPKEVNARVRKAAKAKAAAESGGAPIPKTAQAAISAPRSRRLNLGTYKFHVIGDYATAIPQFGPLDIYSTVIVSK